MRQPFQTHPASAWLTSMQQGAPVARARRIPDTTASAA